MVKSLLSEADAREVEAAVARVEAQSAAEVVVAVLPQSNDYWAGRVLLSVTWALGAGLAFLHFAPWREPMLALVIEVLVGRGRVRRSAVLLGCKGGWWGRAQRSEPSTRGRFSCSPSAACRVRAAGRRC